MIISFFHSFFPPTIPLISQIVQKDSILRKILNFTCQTCRDDDKVEFEGGFMRFFKPRNENRMCKAVWTHHHYVLHRLSRTSNEWCSIYSKANGSKVNFVVQLIIENLGSSKLRTTIKIYVPFNNSSKWKNLIFPVFSLIIHPCHNEKFSKISSESFWIWA